MRNIFSAAIIATIAIFMLLSVYLFINVRNLDHSLKAKEKELGASILKESETIKEEMKQKYKDYLSSYESIYKNLEDEKKKNREMEKNVRFK